ncbi:hypothetical protein ACX80E_07050 [Arthrobacter sp. TMN-49]
MNSPSGPLKKPVEDVLASLGRASSRKALLARGLTDWQLRAALAAGTVRQLARGVYALPDATALAAHLATNQAILDCYSRAETLGLWVLQPPAIPHVATAHGRPVTGCVVHRVKGRLTFWDVLRHCVQCGSDLEALCVVESAVVLKKCTIIELRRVFTRNKDGRIRRIIGMIDPQSMSIAETCGRYRLRQAGYNVQGQAAIAGMGHLDALIDGVLGLEIDGEKYHNDPKAWAEDLRRGNILTVKGIPTLHIKASTAMYYPDVMLDWVRQALATIAAARH